MKEGRSSPALSTNEVSEVAAVRAQVSDLFAVMRLVSLR